MTLKISRSQVSTQPNPPKIKKTLNQPNPWMDPTHDQLCDIHTSHNSEINRERGDKPWGTARSFVWRGTVIPPFALPIPPLTTRWLSQCFKNTREKCHSISRAEMGVWPHDAPLAMPLRVRQKTNKQMHVGLTEKCRSCRKQNRMLNHYNYSISITKLCILINWR